MTLAQKTQYLFFGLSWINFPGSNQMSPQEKVTYRQLQDFSSRADEHPTNFGSFVLRAAH